ncbi:MAG: hypothetical protein CMJ18_22540 [Phycisphaeraceae bacterium]|nr:hypothetical protein [Phycisphaeraceae bacterium]
MLQRSTFSLAAAVTTVILAVFVSGAPILYPMPRMSDHKLSLAGLQRVRLVVERVPGPLRDLGVSSDDVESTCRRILRKAGIEPADNEIEQVLNVKLYALLDPNIEGAIAYVVGLRFNQPASVDRIGRTLNLPTFARIGAGLEKTEDLQKVLMSILSDLIEDFAAEIGRATRQLEKLETEER